MRGACGTMHDEHLNALRGSKVIARLQMGRRLFNWNDLKADFAVEGRKMDIGQAVRRRRFQQWFKGGQHPCANPLAVIPIVNLHGAHNHMAVFLTQANSTDDRLTSFRNHETLRRQNRLRGPPTIECANVIEIFTIANVDSY